jgi:hypothetical protein
MVHQKQTQRSDLNIGDHIFWTSKSTGVEHHGICGLKGKIIHLNTSSSEAAARVRSSTFDAFVIRGQRELWRVEYKLVSGEPDVEEVNAQPGYAAWELLTHHASGPSAPNGVVMPHAHSAPPPGSHLSPVGKNGNEPAVTSSWDMVAVRKAVRAARDRVAGFNR